MTSLIGGTMGDFSMIAAGAVISNDAQPWIMIGGVSAKEIKKIKLRK